jgi:hypothetical protein
MTANTLTNVDTLTPTKPDIAHAHLPLPTVRTEFDPYDFHRLRYLNELVPIEQRDASGQWLLDNGFIGVNGRMIVLRGGQ